MGIDWMDIAKNTGKNLLELAPGGGLITGGVEMAEALEHDDPLKAGSTGMGLFGEATELMHRFSGEGEGGTFEKEGKVANLLKGGLDVGQGLYHLFGEGDDTTKKMKGVHELFEGGGELLEGSGNKWAEAAGKGLKYGMKAGDLIAPAIFGKEDNSAKFEDIPEGGFRPTTGNHTVDGALDWISGSGKYSESRW